MCVILKLGTRKGVKSLTKDHRINVENYIACLVQIKQMLKLGIINKNDFNKMETIIADKYCIKISSIYRLNDLIDSSFRGNIVVNKEVI